MNELETIKSQLQGYRKQLESKRIEKQGYLKTAEDIKVVYDRLSLDKQDIITLRNSVRSFSNESYSMFRGNLRTNVFKKQTETLVERYNTLIKKIDANMDDLNMMRAQYENKAYQCNGPIGYLQSMVNSLVHTVENWVN